MGHKKKKKEGEEEEKRSKRKKGRRSKRKRRRSPSEAENEQMGRKMRQNLEGEDYHYRDFQGRNGGTEKRSDWSKVAQLLSNREENNA